MKKLLLSLAAIAAFSVSAADIVENFEVNKGFPTKEKNPTTVASFTSQNTNITYDILGCYVTTNSYGATPYDYLMVNGKTVKGAYMEFALPIDCQEMVLTTTADCSPNAASKINVYAGEELIGNFAANTKNAEVKVTIPAAYRKAGTKYKVESGTTKYNQQFVSFKYVEVTSEPSVSVDVTTLNFATPKNGKQTKTIKVACENIQGNVTLSSDVEAFEVPASVTVAEAAEGIEVVYNGITVGTTEGEITVSAGGKSVGVAVEGITVANEGTVSNPLTVADVLEMSSINNDVFYVTGTIQDGAAANAKNGVLQVVTPAVASNIVIKGEGESDLIAVALPSKSDARTLLNLVDNPKNAGKTIVIKGSLENYFGVPGVKNTEYVSGLSGVENVEIDANAPVEYFNLQGVRVENPANGLFIVRQGNKVTKQVIR